MGTVAANGIDIAYERYGAETAPAVVMISGLGRQMLHYRASLCQGLADRGLQVIRFDNRDMGRTTSLDALGEPDIRAAQKALKAGEAITPPYTMGDMADDAAALIAALGLGRAVVAGASMGGMIAQEVAIRHPDQVCGLVSIMSTSSRPGLPGGDPDAWRTLNSRPENPDDPASLTEHHLIVQKKIGSPAYPTDPEILKADIAGEIDRGLNPVGRLRQSMAVMAARDRSEDLKRLAVPTTVIHGDVDPIVNVACGRDVAALVPGADLAVIEGMGHDLPVSLEPKLIDLIAAVASRAE